MDFVKTKELLKKKDIYSLKKYVSQVMLDNVYGTISFTTYKFKGFYRARKHTHSEGKLKENGFFHKFINETEFWNVPTTIAEIGRCNDKGESIFYCANDIVTAILEVKPKVGDFVTVSNFTNLFPNKNFRISPVAIRSLSKIPHLNKKLLKNYVFDEKHQEVEDFLDLLFCSEDDSNYNLSIAVSHLFFTESIDFKKEISETHALIYPSIIRNQSSYCFALKPWIAHCYFEISYLQTLEVLEVNKTNLKVKLVRNGQLFQRKVYPTDLSDILWMKPNEEIIKILEY